MGGKPGFGGSGCDTGDKLSRSSRGSRAGAGAAAGAAAAAAGAPGAAGCSNAAWPFPLAYGASAEAVAGKSAPLCVAAII